MERHLHEPLKLPVHCDLLEEINQTIIDIKIQNEEKPLMVEGEALQKLRNTHKKHTLENICELLRKCYSVINEQREDPRRY